MEFPVGSDRQVVQDVGRELACGEVVGDRGLFDGDVVPLPVGGAFGVGEASDDPSDVRSERPGAACGEDGACAADSASLSETLGLVLNVSHPEQAGTRAAIWSSRHRGSFISWRRALSMPSQR